MREARVSDLPENVKRGTDKQNWVTIRVMHYTSGRYKTRVRCREPIGSKLGGLGFEIGCSSVNWRGIAPSALLGREEDMKPEAVYQVLKEIGATHLHHANTVTTSCTFLENAALLSRGYVEKHGLTQTGQSSDEIDKKYGIWDRVFVDHVDIHYRGGRVKGPNQYGPVLFILGLDILETLPAGSDVLVTKMNPIHWRDGQTDGDRCYLTPEELAKNIIYGNFDKMLVIRTKEGKVDIPGKQAQIALDEPKRNLSSGKDAYTFAERRIRQSAKSGGVAVVIEKHLCRLDCTCVEKYKGYAQGYFDSIFE